MGLLIALVLLVALTVALWSAVRSFGESDASLFRVLGTAAVAKLVARLAGLALAGTEALPKIAVLMGVYVLVLAVGLWLVCSVRPVRALVIAVIYSALALAAVVGLVASGLIETGVGAPGR